MFKSNVRFLDAIERTISEGKTSLFRTAFDLSPCLRINRLEFVAPGEAILEGRTCNFLFRLLNVLFGDISETPESLGISDLLFFHVSSLNVGKGYWDNALTCVDQVLASHFQISSRTVLSISLCISLLCAFAAHFSFSMHLTYFMLSAMCHSCMIFLKAKGLCLLALFFS